MNGKMYQVHWSSYKYGAYLVKLSLAGCQQELHGSQPSTKIFSQYESSITP